MVMVNGVTNYTPVESANGQVRIKSGNISTTVNSANNQAQVTGGSNYSPLNSDNSLEQIKYTSRHDYHKLLKS